MNLNLLLKMVVACFLLNSGIYTMSLYGTPFEDDLKSPSISQLDKELKGTITDSNGNPLVGATVRAKSTSQGTLTDAQGKFQKRHLCKTKMLLTI